jgi:hypothetical protein
MAQNDFAEVSRQLEEIASELKAVTDPDRRRTLLREMSRLVERISTQPPKMIHTPGSLDSSEKEKERDYFSRSRFRLGVIRRKYIDALGERLYSVVRIRTLTPNRRMAILVRLRQNLFRFCRPPISSNIMPAKSVAVPATDMG